MVLANDSIIPHLSLVLLIQHGVTWVIAYSNRDGCCLFANIKLNDYGAFIKTKRITHHRGHTLHIAFKLLTFGYMQKVLSYEPNMGIASAFSNA